VAGPIPRAVMTGRRVAQVLLLLSAVVTVIALILLINWWVTRPIVL
jgi:hypothetical protein